MSAIIGFLWRLIVILFLALIACAIIGGIIITIKLIVEEWME